MVRTAANVKNMLQSYVMLKIIVSHFQISNIVFQTATVAAHKRLRGGVRFIDAIPKSPSGKILRRVLRDQLKKELTNK